MTVLLSQAIETAIQAHAGQTDRGGRPYILHPLRLMLEMERLARPEPYLIAAVLHDVAEDTDVSLSRLKQMFGPEVGAALENLTRQPGEDYGHYVERAGKGPISRAVKIADLQDNMRVERLRSFGAADIVRLNRYASALHYLRGLGE